MKSVTLPALNVQAPWAELIVSGKKTIETRFYPLPAAYVGKEMLVIETPGRAGKLKRRVVGVVVFDDSFEYQNRQEFYRDRAKHLVDENSDFAWNHSEKRKKWGWRIRSAKPIEGEIPSNFRTGIVFTRALKLSIK